MDSRFAGTTANSQYALPTVPEETGMTTTVDAWLSHYRHSR